MGDPTRHGDCWAHLLEKIIEFVEKIIQPGGPLGRFVVLLLACTPVAGATALVIAGVIVLSR
ncbi:MAG: hypothetical protein DLM60_15015 [Pseudonocardiales bacterium]|nr:hypothetical protein [Actinomycetota bacterium]PZS16700.1 MAG: hypothetical protein DLM60_15015 [Pseudonocardiales bacterium]